MSPRGTRAGRRNERGTVAIISAASAVVLFGIGAMAVDLGNAFARARDVQASADFAAIAGGKELPGPATNTSANASSAAVIAVADYLNRNQPFDEGAGVCQKTNTCVTATDLVDGDYTNGEVVFSDAGYQMRVYTPAALVKFGLAKVLGASSTSVLRSAKVGVYSPAKALPFYVGEACSWGSQQIVDPPPGNVNPSNNPTLTPASGNFNVKFLAIDPDYVVMTSPTDPLPTITVSMDNTESKTMFDYVGFSMDNGASTYTVALDPAQWVANAATGTWTYQVTVPTEVATVQGYWYVRMHRDPTLYGGTTGWSRSKAILEVDAPNFAIGGTCSSANDGNFGSLFLPRDDATNVGTTLALNTILGIQHTIGKHPNPAPALLDSPQCATNPSINSVRPSDPPATDVVDCVSTDTGNPQTATEGLVTGTYDKNGVFHEGLLDASVSGNETTCNADGTNADRPMPPHTTNVYINDDVLTCFFLAGSTQTVGDISSSSYAGPQVIDPDIFSSPRFVYLPVLTDDPNRGSKYWPIITFRAAFITGQDANASLSNMEASTVNGNNNGLVWKKKTNQGLGELHVVLINNNALPEIAQVNGDVIRYIGSGTKVIRLID